MPGRTAAAPCVTAGCGLPGEGIYGLCGPCEAVHGSALVLCERLVMRELARLEHATPGITDAARWALAEFAAALPRCTAASTGQLEPPAHALMPTRWEIERLDAFVAQLRAATVGKESR